MAATAIIASGTTQASAAAFTLAAGTPTTISLFAASGVQLANDVTATVFKKDSGGNLSPLKDGTLSAIRPFLVIDGPGEFVVTKYASAVAFGVDRD